MLPAPVKIGTSGRIERSEPCAKLLNSTDRESGQRLLVKSDSPALRGGSKPFDKIRRALSKEPFHFAIRRGVIKHPCLIPEEKKNLIMGQGSNKQTAPSYEQPQLQVEGLTCRRGERLLFEEMNFTVSSGDVLEISGHNGSGKTTLLRLLCGLLLPEKGALLWRSQPINKIRPLYHSELAYIGHTDAIKSDLTAHENLLVAGALNGGGIGPDQALERVGLSKLRRLPSRFLSAGQRRRLALARLLVNRARLWLLDEPFTALDKGAIRTIATLLEEHAAAGGMVVFTSHHSIDIAHARTLEISA